VNRGAVVDRLERSDEAASCQRACARGPHGDGEQPHRMRSVAHVDHVRNAPMVQKCVLLPRAEMNVRAKAPHTTMEASAAGLDSVRDLAGTA